MVEWRLRIWLLIPWLFMAFGINDGKSDSGNRRNQEGEEEQ
jgi:hypothetical protein